MATTYDDWKTTNPRDGAEPDCSYCFDAEDGCPECNPDAFVQCPECGEVNCRSRACWSVTAGEDA